MEWYERFGVAAAALGDAFSSAWDIIHGSDDNDPDSQRDMLGLLVRIPIGLGDAAFQAPAGVVQGLYTGYNAVTQPINDTIHRVGATPLIATKLAESPQWQAQQGYTPGGPWEGGGLLDKKEQGLLDSDTWSRAWDMAKRYSIGQAAALSGLLPGDFRKGDILDKDKTQELKDSFLFNAVSGLSDATVSWYADPVSGGLKAVGAAKKVSNVLGAGSNVNDPWLEKVFAGNSRISGAVPFAKKRITDPDVLASSDGADEFLHWAQGRPAWEIARHPIFKKSSMGDDAAGAISVLIGRDGVGDIEDARKVLAVGYGSKLAREQLMAKNDDLAIQLNNLENLQNPALRKAIGEKDPSIYTDKYNEQYEAYTQALLKGEAGRNPPSPRYKIPVNQLEGEFAKTDAYQKAITAAVGESKIASGIEGSLMKQVPKVGMDTRADRLIAYDRNSLSQWSEITFPKPFAPALKVMSWPGFKMAHQFTDKRPPSLIDPNRKEASGALWSYMKTSKAFDDRTMEDYSTQYLEALDISSRRSVIETVEGDAIVRLALKRGIDLDTARAVAKEGIGRRNSLMEKFRQAVSEGRIYGVTDDDGNVVRLPAFETQEVNSIPLADLDAYDRVFKKHTGAIKALGWAGKYNGSLVQMNSELFEAFLSVWSSINLLRPGYTVRNFTDDSLRSLASLGALNLVGQTSAGVKNGLGNLPARTVNAGIRLKLLGDAVGAVRKESTRMEGSNNIRLLVDQMGRDLHSLKTQSNDGFIYDGHDYSAPYNGRAASYQRVVGSDFSAVSGTTGAMVSQFRNDFAPWGVVKPGDPGHLTSWAHAIQNQIGYSEIGKRFLEGKNAAQVKTWLTTTAEGRAARRKLGSAGKDVDRVVGEAQAITDYIVPLRRDLPDPFILRDMALRGEVDDKALEKLFPDVDMRPSVHGPTIALNLSVGPISDAFHSIIDKGFKFFGSMPTDKLVRHPTFRAMYLGNVRMLHNNLKRQIGKSQMTDVDFARIEHAAREMSLKQLNGLLFDGSTTSNIAHKLRFMTGFFSAWQDSITKWAKIAYDKPEILTGAMKMWNAPNEMNLGSTPDPLNPNRRIPRWQVLRQNEKTGEWEQAGKDWDIWSINDPNVVIQARLPEWVRDFIPYATEDDGSVTIAKSSLNLSLQGDAWWLPGAGPITNMLVSTHVKDHPTSLTDVYKWAIPYGGEDNLVYGLLPAWSRRLWTSGESITNGTRASTFLNILQTQSMKVKLGMRKPPPSKAAFMEEIEQRTDDFFKLRAFTSFFSPVAVQYNSPFKFYIDQYRTLKQKESQIDVQAEMAKRRTDPGHYVPVTADEQFLEQYGEDFYAFTTAVSKNNLGLPASAEAWDKSQRADVQKYIDAGELDKAALLVGKIEDPSFNQYVYDAQFRQTVGGPDSGKTAREHQDPEDAIKANQVRLGWTKYTQVMDLLDGMQFDQGYDPDFIDFVRTKVAQKLALDVDDEGRPKLSAWGEDFYNTDPEKVPTTIRNFENFLNDNQKLAMNRPDLRVLSVYLTARQQMLNELKDRKEAGGDSTLKARSNADLAQKWKNFQVGLAESNTVFGRIFWRYLSNDRLQTSALDNK